MKFLLTGDPMVTERLQKGTDILIQETSGESAEQSLSISVTFQDADERPVERDGGGECLFERAVDEDYRRDEREAQQGDGPGLDLFGCKHRGFVFLRSTCAVRLRRFPALRQGGEGQTAGRIADEACVAMRSAWRPRPSGGAKKRCECLCACCGSWHFGGGVGRFLCGSGGRLEGVRRGRYVIGCGVLG